MLPRPLGYLGTYCVLCKVAHTCSKAQVSSNLWLIVLFHKRNKIKCTSSSIWLWYGKELSDLITGFRPLEKYKELTDIVHQKFCQKFGLSPEQQLWYVGSVVHRNIYYDQKVKATPIWNTVPGNPITLLPGNLNFGNWTWRKS